MGSHASAAQPDLFRAPAPRIAYQPPAVHHADPVTSYRGEKKANIKGQALTLYHLLREHGPCTMHELADATGFDYYVAQKRVSVLQKNAMAGVVRVRACRITGNDCQEWATT